MSKRWLEQKIKVFLTKRAIAESEQDALCKKIGQGLILLSAAVVMVPLVIDGLPVPIKILIQMLFAIFIFVGASLAFDEDKNE